MKICRYEDDRIGLVRGQYIHDVSAILGELPTYSYPPPFGDALIWELANRRVRLESLADTANPIPVVGAKLLSPVARPSKIIGTPANYHAHVSETDRDAEISVYAGGRQRSIEEQGLFLKAASSIVGPGEGVTIRFPSRRTDHEVELGIVIGSVAANVSETEALDYVAGYSIALDMVVRGAEDRSFRKSPDSYAVLGPWLVTADEVGDPDSLSFFLDVNGEPRQASDTKNMIIGVARQIAWASSVYTLYPGDIIMSGTCEGVGPVKAGDVMRAGFSRIGEMNISIRSA